MRRSARPAWLLAAALAVPACRRATETVVAFDAAAQTRQRAAAARVRACNQDGQLLVDRTVSLMGAGEGAGAWPLRVPLVPRAGDVTRRFAVIAEAIDAAGVTFSRARVVGGYEADEANVAARLLDDACQGVLTCGRLQTCAGGACVDARVAPAVGGAMPCDPLVACANPPCASYGTGFGWLRSRDWKPGARVATAEGNPAPDAAGLPAWQYELTTGGDDLRGAAPWYRQPTRLMVWDDNWFGAGGGWARSDDVGPDAQPGYFDVILGDPAGPAPVVRWVNPTARDVVVDVRGAVRLLWQGGATAPVDVVVARARGDGTTEPLVAQTLPASKDGASVDVQLAGVAVGAADALIVTAHSAGTDGWITVIDGLTLTLVDAPAVR